MHSAFIDFSRWHNNDADAFGNIHPGVEADGWHPGAFEAAAQQFCLGAVRHPHQFDQRLCIIPAVGNEVAAGLERSDQHRRDGLVRRLALRQDNAHRQAGLVDDGVDLGAQSSTRTANGVIRTPFLPPAACWWARTIELSMNCKDWGERAANVSKIRSHTPALAQRL